MASYMDKQRLPSGEEVWRCDKGELHIRFPAPGIVEFQCIGHFTPDFADMAGDPITRARESAPHIFIFVDCDQMTGYDSAFRTKVTDRLRIHGKRTRLPITFLVRSKLLAMGITVASVALRGTPRVYSEREEYNRVKEAAIKKARPR